jgi:hypothetical protein
MTKLSDYLNPINVFPPSLLITHCSPHFILYQKSGLLPTGAWRLFKIDDLEKGIFRRSRKKFKFKARKF